MGMFSSLFGSAGSDKADKYYQQALDAFNSIKTPELSSLQIQLQKYVQEGTLTPEQAEASLLNSNAFNAVKADPAYSGATKQALQQLQQISVQGMTPIDKARVNDITNEVNAASKGRRGAILQNAQERGIGGSGLELANQLSNEQEMSNEAANRGLQVSSDAQARALQALQAQGNLGLQAGAQDVAQQAQKAQAQNAIDAFNAATQNQVNQGNVTAANAAQAANLANKQNISSANTTAENANRQNSAAANQQVFQDQLAKAQGVAGVAQNAAQTAQQTKNAETGANMALTGGLLNAVMPAVATFAGGPAAGAVTSGFMPTSGANNDTTKKIGESMGYAEGGKVPCYSEGGSLDEPVNRNMGSYEEGGMVELPKDELIEEHKRLIPQLTGSEKEEQTKELHEYEKTPPKKEKKSMLAGIGDLIGSHADAANQIDDYSEGGNIQPKQPLPIEWNQEANKWELKDENKQVIGSFDDYATATEAANKAEASAKDFRDGGKVPGKAKVDGDSPKNDTVPAMLSPGELVVPRSAASDEEEFEKFVNEHFKKKMAKGGMVQPQVPSPKFNPVSITRRPPPPKPPMATPLTIVHALRNLQRPKGGL